MLILRPTIENEEIPSSEIIISNFNAMGSKVKKENHIGIMIQGSDITISSSSLLNYKFGIKLAGERVKIIDTKIKMEKGYIPDTEISGILLIGLDNSIENSEIKGYVSKNNNDASDISMSKNEKHQLIISAKIINTALLDPKLFDFRKTVNEESFLEVYGYNAPFAQSKNLPENFMLKKIGSDTIEERGEYNNLEFDAMIKMLPKEKLKNQLDVDDEKTKSGLIQSFKNKALTWGENELTDEAFLDEIEILFESRLVEIGLLELGSFQEIEFTIPNWVKKLVVFWNEDSISDEEFINAIEFVLKSEISKDVTSYG